MTMCANHPDQPAAAYCRSCGKPLCESCRVEIMGAIYCAEHMPVAQKTAEAPPLPLYTQTPYSVAATGQSPYTAPARRPSPALATLLGLIPGVGAIYNGQYAKGLVHAVIVGLLISVLSTEPSPPVAVPVSLLLAAWWFYMMIEANQTAQALRAGRPVDEISSLLRLNRSRTGFPAGAAVLIGAGLLLLLNTTGLVSLGRLIRYWPVGLILLGVYLRTPGQRGRLSSRSARNSWTRGADHEIESLDRCDSGSRRDDHGGGSVSA